MLSFFTWLWSGIRSLIAWLSGGGGSDVLADMKVILDYLRSGGDRMKAIRALINILLRAWEDGIAPGPVAEKHREFAAQRSTAVYVHNRLEMMLGSSSPRSSVRLAMPWFVPILWDLLKDLIEDWVRQSKPASGEPLT